MQVPYLTPAEVGEEDVLDADGQEERKVSRCYSCAMEKRWTYSRVILQTIS